MTWGATAVAGATIAGSYLSSQAAKSAANTSADAQREAAAAAQFRPVGVTTNFGSSNFTMDPNTGYLTNAGYNLTPQLSGVQSGLLGTAAGYNYNPDTSWINNVRQNSLTGMNMARQQAPNAFNAGNLMYAQAPNLFSKGEAAYGQGNMLFGQGANIFPQANAQFINSQTLANAGAGYLAQDPATAQANYLAKSRAALAPGDEQALAAVRNKVFQTGRAGLATGGTTAGGLLASNPELAAFYNAQAIRDLNLNATAAEQARADTTTGANLYSSGANVANTGANMYGMGANVIGAGGNMYNIGANQYGTAASLTNAGSNALSTGGGLLTTSSNLGTNAINQELGKYQIQNAALNTLGNYLGQANTIESMGQQSLNLGSSLGGRTAAGGAAAAPYYTSAAQTQQVGNAYSYPGAVLQGAAASPALNTWFDKIIGNPSTANYYNTNVGSEQTRMLAAQDAGIGTWSTK